MTGTTYNERVMSTRHLAGPWFILVLVALTIGPNLGPRSVARVQVKLPQLIPWCSSWIQMPNARGPKTKSPPRQAAGELPHRV